MPSWLIRAARVCGPVTQMILLASLLNWALAAPIVWILRDGLGPDTVETVGLQAAYRFLVLWGVPASVLATPLVIIGVSSFFRKK